jgi:hypothetical protein
VGQGGVGAHKACVKLLPKVALPFKSLFTVLPFKSLFAALQHSTLNTFTKAQLFTHAALQRNALNTFTKAQLFTHAALQHHEFTHAHTAPQQCSAGTAAGIEGAAKCVRSVAWRTCNRPPAHFRQPRPGLSKIESKEGANKGSPAREHPPTWMCRDSFARRSRYWGSAWMSALMLPVDISPALSLMPPPVCAYV